VIVGPVSVHDVLGPLGPPGLEAVVDDDAREDADAERPGQVAPGRVEVVMAGVEHGVVALHVGVEGDGAAVAVEVARVVRRLDVLHLHGATNGRPLPLQHGLVRRSATSNSL